MLALQRIPPDEPRRAHMTTIAFKNGVIASDTREVGDDVYRRCTKLYKDCDDVIAAAGDTYTGLLFVEWFRDGEGEEDKPDLTSLEDDNDFECLVWRAAEGKLYTVNRMFTFSEVCLEDHPFYAIGSGALGALCAMANGASAKRAVEIVSEFEINTGLPVETMKCKGS